MAFDGQSALKYSRLYLGKVISKYSAFYPITMLMYPDRNHNIMNDSMYQEPLKYIKGLLDLAQHVLYTEEAQSLM